MGVFQKPCISWETGVSKTLHFVGNGGLDNMEDVKISHLAVDGGGVKMV